MPARDSMRTLVRTAVAGRTFSIVEYALGFRVESHGQIVASAPTLSALLAVLDAERRAVLPLGPAEAAAFDAGPSPAEVIKAQARVERTRKRLADLEALHAPQPILDQSRKSLAGAVEQVVGSSCSGRIASRGSRCPTSRTRAPRCAPRRRDATITAGLAVADGVVGSTQETVPIRRHLRERGALGTRQ